MTNEDRVAAKLAGKNCLVKFIDGEELYLKIRLLDDPTSEEFLNWFSDVEMFINSSDAEDHFPLTNVAFNRRHIKYVKIL